MKDIMQKLAELEATAPKVTKKKMLNEDSTTPPMNVSNKPASLKDVFAALSENVIPGQKPLPVLDPQKKQAGMGFVTSDNPAVQNMLKNLDPKDVQIVQAPGQPGQPQVGQQQQTGQPAQAGATGQPQAGQMQMKEKDEGKPGKNFAKIAKSAGERYGSKAAGERVAGAVRAKLAKQGKLEEVDMGQAEKGMRKSTPHTGGYNVVDKAGKVISTHKGQRDAMQAALKNDDYKVKPIKEGAKVDRMVKHIEKSEKKSGKSKEEAQDIAWATANKRGMLDNKNKKKVKEGDIAPTNGIDTRGAGLGAGRSATTLEGKKPDFLDLDKDGNKKESMKKAAADKNKKKVDESMNHRISAARLEGKSHGLRGHAHSGKRYEDLDEIRAYHEGYKEGLDECYGQGVYETAPAATVGGMASQAMPTMEDDMEEGNAFTAALAKTPKGGKFSVGGKTFTDRTSYDAKVNEYAFESADLDEALVNPMGKVARELRGLKSIAKDTPHAQLPGAMGAGSGAATGIAAAATMGAGAAAFLPIVGAAALGGWGLMKAGQLTGKVLNYLAQKVFGTKEEALEFVKAHLEAARGGETSFQHNGKTYKVSLKPGQISQLYSDIEDLTSQIKDKKLDKSLAPDTTMGKIGAALKEDPVFESLDNQLNALLNESEEVNEGLSVSISKGQQNSPDSVTITAQDAEAEHLLAFVKNAGLGLFGDDNADTHSSAMSIQPSDGAPDEVGAGGVDIGVVDGHDGMMGLMQKLTGIQSGGDEDYADEEGDEEQLYGNDEAADKKDCGCDGDCECSDYDKPSNEQACNECGGMMEAGHSCGSKMDEEETPDQELEMAAEDNAPDSGAAETTADEDAEAKEDSALAGAMSKDEEEVNESFFDLLGKLTKLAEAKEEDEEDEEDVTESKEEDEEDVAEEKTEKKGMSDKQAKFFGKKADKEKIDEWANEAGKKGTDAAFEADIDFMTKVIAGGLNKPKSTGQTTVPVIAGQESRMHDHQGTVSDSIDDWTKLAGIK